MEYTAAKAMLFAQCRERRKVTHKERNKAIAQRKPIVAMSMYDYNVQDVAEVACRKGIDNRAEWQGLAMRIAHNYGYDSRIFIADIIDEAERNGIDSNQFC